MTGTDSIGMSTLGRKVGGLSLAIALVLGATTAAQAAQVYTHHVRDAVTQGAAKQVGSMDANQLMQLDIVLPLSDKAALDQFVAEVTNPSSPQYRHYLTPAQFTARFGPSQSDYATVRNYLVKNGFAIVGGSRDALDIQVIGPVSAVESAFNVKMHNYQHPTESRTFYSPDREPNTTLAIPLWHVSGLSNYSIPKPLFVKKGEYAAANGISPDAVVSHATTGSGPSASFLGSDMRGAYYGGTSLTGKGENLGLFEYEGTNLSDLTLYYKNAKQTQPLTPTVISTDGTSTTCTNSQTCSSDGEQTLDMTQALGMAPGLASLVMYVGSTDTAIIGAMTTHSPLPSTIGCSWGWTPDDPSTLDPYFEKMAAQGQTFFAASGDSSTWSSKNEAWPADDAYVISVGGTDLTTSSAGGAWKSETAWVDSGGGISPDKIAIPSWQAASGIINSTNKGSSTYRNGPDVSANANFTFYVCAMGSCTANEYGGTSFAAPMWAAFTALANQQAVAGGKARIGNFNATIYPQNWSGGKPTSLYTTNFHDITSGKSGSYSATTNFDLVTGWGSPKAALINSL